MNNLSQYLMASSESFSDKTAVSIGKEGISYDALNSRSNRLANYLLQLGLKPGDRVAIYLQKSIEAVIAIYGIMKVRGVYVPIDPLAPFKRVEYIMKNSGVRFLVSKNERVIHLIPVIKEGMISLQAVLLFDEFEHDIDIQCKIINGKEIEQQENRLSKEIIHQHRKDDNAYILYTSGSTGRPKGVTLSHKNGMCFIDWAVKEMGLYSDDVFSNHAPFQFDLTIFDLFAAAKVGGTLVLIPDKVKAIGSVLIKYIINKKITVWYSVPLALIKIIKSENFRLLRKSDLRTIIFAGEVFHLKYLRQIYRMMTDVTYYNLYGPTESNVCTYYKVQKSDIDDNNLNSLPIGRACDYSFLFAIAKDGNALDLSEGGEGELCITGDSVMPGYWNDSEKNAGAFIPIPSRFGIDGRAYLSGDIVRQDSEGNYIYVERKDRMVKCKGYRIELNEIESVIGEIEHVKEVAVVTVEHLEYENKIIAFVSLHQKGVIYEKVVLQICQQKLPKYMIPEQIYVLEDLPRTITEKIDYTQLKQSLTYDKNQACGTALTA